MKQISFFDCRETGVWLKNKNQYKCRDCRFMYYDGTKTPYRFCPICGREMKVKVVS